MAYSTTCQQCGQSHRLTTEHFGRQFSCTRCGQPLKISSSAPPAQVIDQRRQADKPAGLLGWIRQGVKTVFDPLYEKRITHQGISVYNDLAKAGRAFKLPETLARCHVRSGETDSVLEYAYGIALNRAWQDRQVTEAEQKSLQWIASMLQLSTQQVSRLNGEKAKAAFESLFVEAISNGYVDDAEFARLEHIARAVNSTVPQLCRMFFREEAENLLRGVFAGVVEDKRVVADEWNRFMQTSMRLGLAQGEVLQIVQPQAMAFVEHVLADAKADERLSPEEEQTLLWMLQVFVLPPDFVHYVQVQLFDLKVFTEILCGRLPSITQPIGIETRAGEIVHYADNVVYETTKYLKSGPRVIRHPGRVVVTDSRLVFSSPSKSMSINLRTVLECNLGTGCIDLRTTSKGIGLYYFQANPRLAHAVIRTAVGRANQTVVSSYSDGSRHIPRDVRQRVWQRFGGRCVECQSTQYLEFDHIIPVARGGNNGDNNVQLLCRGCNQKKSDHI